MLTDVGLITQSEINNRVLIGLRASDFELLRPHLERVQLNARRYLQQAGRRINSIYFLEDGLVSVMATARPAGKQAEVALIGRESMTGFSLVHGLDRAIYDMAVQIPGTAYAIDAAVRVVLNISRTLRPRLLLYSHNLYHQTAAGTLAHAVGTVEERLSRWILMTQDRIGRDEIGVTHEVFSMVLAVRRPGVTLGLHRLEEEGLISLRRGATVVVDREGLVRRSNGLYGQPEAEYERLFGG